MAQANAGRTSWFWPAALLVCALGALLRLWRLDLAEFKADELEITRLVLALVQHGDWPTLSAGSSIGTNKPPLFLYLEALPALVSPTPLALTFFVAVLDSCALAGALLFARRYFGEVAALTGSILFATAPWAVVYSRKIWEPDAVPFFVLLFFIGLFAVVVDRQPAFLILCGAAASVAWQLHTSAIALVAVGGAALLLWPRRFPLRFLGAGAVAAVLPLLPYLRAESRLGFADWVAAFSHGSLSHADRLADTASAWQLWAQVSSGWQVEGLLAPTSATPTFAGVAAWLGWLFAAAGLLTVLGSALRDTVWLSDTETSKRTILDERLVLLALWVALPPIVLGLTGLPLYAHYFILSYPAPFLAIGVLAARLLRGAHWPRLATGGGLAALATGGGLAALAVANVLTVLWMLSVAATMPPRAEYGLPMTYSEQAATVIDRDAAAGTIVVVVEPDIRDGTAVIGQLVAWRGPRVLVGGEGGPATRRYWVQEPKTAPPEGGHILAAIGPAGKPPLVLVWAREPA